MLSEKEIERYSRQLILSSWNSEKQLRLKHCKIAIDARLTSTAFYLAAAGASNLLLFGENSKKLAQRLKELNATLEVSAEQEASHLLEACTFVIELKEDVLIILQDSCPIFSLTVEQEELARLKAGTLFAATLISALGEDKQ